MHVCAGGESDLVPLVGLVLEAEGQAEGRVVGLKQSIAVLALVQSAHGVVQLLEPVLQVLLHAVPVGQEATHDPRQCQVVPQICALKHRNKKTNKKKIPPF